MKICSECLLGVACRYDGNSKASPKVLELLKTEILVPVCPEQLGGLPTPREAAEILEGKVVTKSGKDVTENFMAGARTVLELARIFNINEAILKQGSPSCGNGQIYNGNFEGSKIRGNGITAQLLLDNGIRVISEEDL